MTKIEDLFNLYQTALNEFNSELIGVLYDFPCVIATSDNLISFIDHQAIESYLEKMIAGYKSHGITQAMILKLEIDERSPVFAHAHVNWGLYDANFQEVVKFDVSYTLRQNSNRWQIICVTAHNEVEEFAELSRI